MSSLSLHDSIKLALKDYEWIDYDKLYNLVDDIWGESKKERERKLPTGEDSDNNGFYVLTKGAFNKQISALLKEKAIDIKRELINSKPEEWNSELDKPKYSFILRENLYKSIVKNFNHQELANHFKSKLTNYSLTIYKSNKTDLKHNKISTFVLSLPSKFSYNPDFHKIVIDIYKYNNPTDAYNSFIDKIKFRIGASYKDITQTYRSKIEMNFSYAIYEIYTNEDDDMFFNSDIFAEFKYLKYIVLMYNMVFCIYSNFDKEYDVAIQSGKLIAEYLESIK